MKTMLIFSIIYAAMIATSFWEAYVEGRNAWDRKKLGWKIRFFGKYSLPAYHFYLFFIMFPLLLSLPFVIYGWDRKLFGIIASAYFSGLVIEDFMWYVVNPAVKLSEFNSKFVTFHPWVRFGKLEVPLLYIIALLFSFISLRLI